MKSKYEFEINDLDSTNFKNIDDYSRIYKQYGVLVFRGFFKKDPIFLNFYNEIKELACLIVEKHSLDIEVELPLSGLLTEISKTHRKEIGHIYDLGTRPLKLMSGIQLKAHPVISGMLKKIMGENSILACPYLGETLHIFPPGEENFKYNLPMHQDYPYIMQSPDQITAYINLGDLQEAKNGGIKVWLGSHKEKISPSRDVPNRLRVTANAEHFENNFDSVDLAFDVGDFAIFDSLIQHQGIQNHTDQTRIVQLIRYSNLNQEDSVSYSWASCEGFDKGIQFKDVHN